jgi:hypothetical protein
MNSDSMSRALQSFPAFLASAVVVGPASVLGLLYLLDAFGVDTTQLPGAVAVLLLAVTPSVCIYALGKVTKRTAGQITAMIVVIVPVTAALLALLVVIALSNANLN